MELLDSYVYIDRFHYALLYLQIRYILHIREILYLHRYGIITNLFKLIHSRNIYKYKENINTDVNEYLDIHRSIDRNFFMSLINAQITSTTSSSLACGENGRGTSRTLNRRGIIVSEVDHHEHASAIQVRMCKLNQFLA